MKVRRYYLNLLCVNNKELPNLPPFSQDNMLSNNELLDILLFGTPRSWQKEMDRQNFDPLVNGLAASVDFMEAVESTEEFEPIKPKAKSTPNTKKKSSDQDDKKAPHCCEQHGPNCTHDTKDCRFLNNKKSGNKFGDKTWNCKASEASAQSKKDLATLIGKTVNKAVKKQLASANKKRKSDEDNDCFLVQELSKELDGFNYEAMENLHIGTKEDAVPVDDDSSEVHYAQLGVENCCEK